MTPGGASALMRAGRGHRKGDPVRLAGFDGLVEAPWRRRFLATAGGALLLHLLLHEVPLLLWLGLPAVATFLGD